eukprot:SAG11_NODE_1358_length_5120_cov_1.838080_4_plen_149_part_00
MSYKPYLVERLDADDPSGKKWLKQLLAPEPGTAADELDTEPGGSGSESESETTESESDATSTTTTTSLSTASTTATSQGQRSGDSSSSSSSSDGAVELWRPGGLMSGESKPRYTGVVRKGATKVGARATGEFQQKMRDTFKSAGSQAW